MDLYINSAGIISSSGNNKTGRFAEEPVIQETDLLPAREPDYTGEIPPMQLRRMSKAVRMGIAASKIAMQQAGIEKPDAISVGTAMGCMQDTETFLVKMIEQEEQMLTPTAFIQSTHNTVGGQIALLTGCYGHNLTYVHRGHSFEHALINAQLYLEAHPGEKILVGGIDELSQTSLDVLRQAKIYREDAVLPQSILTNTAEGSLAGEGASFFIVTDKPVSDHYLHVKDITTFTTTDNNVALEGVNEFLHANALQAKDIDLVMLGISGDKNYTQFYEQLQKTVFKNNHLAAFKHLSGEYGTASAFAAGMLMQAVTEGSLAGTMLLNEVPSGMKNIVIINNYMHYFSCWYIITPH